MINFQGDLEPDLGKLVKDDEEEKFSAGHQDIPSHRCNHANRLIGLVLVKGFPSRLEIGPQDIQLFLCRAEFYKGLNPTVMPIFQQAMCAAELQRQTL